MKPISIAILSAAVGVGFFSGCALVGGGPGPRMTASPAVPAAEGHASFAKASNGNTSIDVTVKHLAEPRKLTPPANNYVVWLRTSKDAAPQNIGELTVDSDLVGRLTTVTALHNFDLFITAEAAGQVQQPTGRPLLWTSHSD